MAATQHLDREEAAQIEWPHQSDPVQHRVGEAATHSGNERPKQEGRQKNARVLPFMATREAEVTHFFQQ
jgi:hypothetical protein